MRKVVVVLVLALTATSAMAQVVGNLRPATDNTILTPTNQLLFVDLLSPATANGSLTTATVNWAGGPCTGGFRLKFFRRGPGDTYTMTTQRGPFDPIFGLTTVPLNPPVPVVKGDYIGVQYLRADCGSPIGSNGDPAIISAATINADAQSFDLKTATPLRGFELNARASAATEVFEGTIVVAGAAQGSFGSNFRTTVVLTNGRSSGTLTGRLVYHPAGQTASASDPSVNYTIAPGATVTFNDIVASLGRTGVGSIDLYSTGSHRPIVNARVYDDRGAQGTSGFSEELLTPREALGQREQDYFAIPTDPNFRQNIGIRTLGDGATIQFVSQVPNTNAIAAFTEREYGPNFFQQVPAVELFGASNLLPGGAIRIRVTAGTAFFYVSTTDNRTNDSSARFGKRQ